MDNDLKLDNFNYDLPKEKIAEFSVNPRDNSKLLFYDKGQIQHLHFYDLPNLIDNGLIVFNNSKVVPARFIFLNQNGGKIEVLLLYPYLPINYESSFSNNNSVIWECQIGNKKKWKSDQILSSTKSNEGRECKFQVSYDDYEKNLLKFQWTPELKFSEIIEIFGNTPLPPYIKRELSQSDKDKYQTVYSKYEGSVAAPTAGLHFTTDIIDKLFQKGIKLNYVTLHVGAGTFLPIKEKNIMDHKIHKEFIVFTKGLIEELIQNIGNTIAVGTTSMRVLETIYWIGIKLIELRDFDITVPVSIEQDYIYSKKTFNLPGAGDSLQKILQVLKQSNQNSIVAETQIFIYPGYQSRICNKLITNFHMPESTLLPLVAAFVGDNWRKVYQVALENNYRFLSYGDSSFLIP